MTTGIFAWIGFISLLFQYKIKNVQCFFLWLFLCGKYISELLHLAFSAGGLERGRHFSLPSYTNKGVGVSTRVPPRCPVPITGYYALAYLGLTHSPSPRDTVIWVSCLCPPSISMKSAGLQSVFLLCQIQQKGIKARRQVY